MKKYIKLLCVVMLIFATIIFTSENALLSIDEYKTVFCVFGEVEDSIVCSGKIVDIESSVINVDHPAYFSEVTVKEGDKVSAGDIIARIDITRTVELLQRLDSEQISDMMASIGITDALQAAMMGEIPELSKYRNTIEKLLTSEGIIRSPRDGIVTALGFTQGELIMDPSSAVVSDRSVMGIKGSVAAEYSRYLSIGSSAIITSDCFTETINATITNISSNADSNGQVTIALQFENTSDALKNGFPVTIRIGVNQTENALLLPFECVFEDGGNEGHVFIREGDRARRVDVGLGVRTTEHTQIISGLSGREEVILTDGNDLSDGQFLRYYREE